MDAAVRMLARREHSAQELIAKLIAKGIKQEVAATVVDELNSRNLVSDQRFMEALIAARVRRGYGPLRIRQELQQRGVQQALAEECLAVHDPVWLERLHRVWSKKFAGVTPKNYAEWARQARFLQHRGFSTEQIKQVVQFER